MCESIIGGGTIARRLLLLEEVPNSVFQNNPRKVRNFIASLYTVAILALVLKRTFLASFVALLAQDAAAYNAASPITQSKKTLFRLTTVVLHQVLSQCLWYAILISSELSSPIGLLRESGPL